MKPTKKLYSTLPTIASNQIPFFQPILRQANMFENIGLVARALLDYILFAIVVVKSPFKRELKRRFIKISKERLDQEL